MALRNIAIGYNDSPNSAEAVRLAVRLCQRNGASLTGLHVRVPLTEEPQIRTWMPISLMDSLHKASIEGVQRAEQSFRKLTSSDGFEGPVNWVTEDGDVNDKLSSLARYFDLLVMGQYSSTGETDRFGVRAQNVVMRAGRPLLIVPAGYSVIPEQTCRFAVAWDGSRPAARALNDAVQLFGTSNQVDVVSVVPRARNVQKLPFPRRDIIRHLSLHGVDANAVRLSSENNHVARALLQHCQDAKPDFLVMGAYNHARLREDLFGGVTKYILENMTIPVLMSH